MNRLTSLTALTGGTPEMASEGALGAAEHEAVDEAARLVLGLLEGLEIGAWPGALALAEALAAHLQVSAPAGEQVSWLRHLEKLLEANVTLEGGEVPEEEAWRWN